MCVSEPRKTEEQDEDLFIVPKVRTGLTPGICLIVIPETHFFPRSRSYY